MAYGAVGPSFAVGDPRPRELAFGWSPRDYWSSVCFMLLISSPCTLSPPPPVQPDSGPPALLNCAKDSVPHPLGGPAGAAPFHSTVASSRGFLHLDLSLLPALSVDAWRQSSTPAPYWRSWSHS